MRGETAIEKHLRLQKQADELAEKIDFNACVHVLRTRDLAVTQAKKLFESRGWWKPASWRAASRAVSRMRRTMMSTANPLSIRRSSEKPGSKGGNRTCCGQGHRRHNKTKKSKLFDTPLSEIVLHRNCNCWQNTPGVHIQRVLHELELVVFSPMNIRSLLKEGQREVPRVELLKFLEAVGDCDTEMDFEETRCVSD